MAVTKSTLRAWRLLHSIINIYLHAKAACEYAGRLLEIRMEMLEACWTGSYDALVTKHGSAAGPNSDRTYTADSECAGFINYMSIHHQLFAPEHLVKRVTNCLSQQTRSRMTRFAS